MKKILSSMLIIGVLALSIATIIPPEEALAGIKDTIRSENIGTLESNVDQAGSSLISFIRGIAIIVAIVMLLWMGFLKFFSGDAQSISQMKVKLGVFVLAIIFTFKTEAILGALFNLFGVDLNAL
ncbi:hypothetical protein [Calidifontibacillus erzurumensis]|uniref:hypothetical protein n=1 Tax=Calidifontibacillus erzurumensis TaxID=2741433 RepID=UPI0035B5355B